MTDLNRRNVLKAMQASAALFAAPGVASAAVAAATPAVRGLPKGVSKANFARAIEEMRKIVGAEWVFADTESILPYKKVMVPDPYGQHVPSGAVAPASVEEVQALVGVANKYKIPLWMVSTGKNMGYGSAAPATPGQMVLDLKRMNRILEVDAELGYALIEPGVTYQQLADYIAENKLPLWIDVPSPGPIVSPVGNCLERGGGYTPYGDHFGAICGMEVVLPDGQVMRTGQGSVKNSKAWQAFKYGYGPYVDGLFSQSNFGIVTKMGLLLMAAPPAYKPFTVRYKKIDDLAKLLDMTRDFQLHGVIFNLVLVMSGLYLYAERHRRSELWDKPGVIPDDVIAKAVEAEGIGMWNAYFALYGTDESIALVEPMIRQAFESTGGEVLTAKEMGDNFYFKHHETLMRGGLTLDEKGITRWRGDGGGLSWFAPVGAARGKTATEEMALAKSILAKYDIDYTAAWGVAGRSLWQILAMLWDKSDPAADRRAYLCYEELLREFGERGLAPYRVGTHAMDLTAKQYGKVNHEFNQKLKAALDPNGIIAPGKSGIY
jgi:4-cresol dehydrogenase (hydroxylating)